MKKKNKKFYIYKRIFLQLCNDFQFIRMSDHKALTDCARKIVISGVKFFKCFTREDIMENLTFSYKTSNAVLSAMLTFTPEEIANLFPPYKDYDGEKYGSKDYFYAQEKIQEWSMIGFQGDIEYLKEYLGEINNFELIAFRINCDYVDMFLEEINRELIKKQKIKKIKEKFNQSILLKPIFKAG